MIANPQLQIVKVGGSLLSSPETPDRFRLWLKSQTDHQNILIAGGGARVDAVRARYQAGQLNECESHWQAINSMSDNAHRLQEWLDVPMLERIEAVHMCSTRNLVFDVEPWMRSRNDFPISWSLTSDSIAAALATDLKAPYLTLLKSCLPPSDSESLYELSQTTYVDQHFHRYASPLACVRMIDLTTCTGDDPRSLPAVYFVS